MASSPTLRSGKVNQWTGDRVVAFQKAYDEYLGSGRSHRAGQRFGRARDRAARVGHRPGRRGRRHAAHVRRIGLLRASRRRDARLRRCRPRQRQLTAETIAAVLTPRTKAVIPVHLAGWPADMDGDLRAGRRARPARASRTAPRRTARAIDGRPVGTFGHAAAFSFCQDKIMSTGGEGGMHLPGRRCTSRGRGRSRTTARTSTRSPRRSPAAGFRWVHDARRHQLAHARDVTR